MFGIICGFHNLKRELKRYLLLLFELAAAAVFACICVNVMLSYRALERWNERLPAAELTEVAAAGGASGVDKGMAVSPEDYRYLKQKYGEQTDFQLIYCIEHLENFYKQGTGVKTVPVLYVSDEYISCMLRAVNSLQQGAMSAELREFLSGEDVMRMGSYEAGELLEAAPQDIKELDMTAELYTRFTSYGASEKETIPYQDCVLLPLSAYRKRDKVMETSFLYLTADRELLYQKYGEILDYLRERGENQNPATGEKYYSYTFANQLSGLEQANELALEEYKIIMYYMSIGIGIIFINMCGILLLTVSRRKEEYALQLVVGAGRGQLYAGMLAELGTVVFAGLAVGSIVGSFIIRRGLDSVRFPVQSNPLAFAVIGLSGLLLMIISSLPFAVTLYRLEPAELLQ